MYRICICNNEPQAELIIVGDVVGTKYDDAKRGIVIAVISEEQFKVATEHGEIEDWVNPYKFSAHYDIFRVADLVDALLDL